MLRPVLRLEKIARKLNPIFSAAPLQSSAQQRISVPPQFDAGRVPVVQRQRRAAQRPTVPEPLSADPFSPIAVLTGDGDRQSPCRVARLENARPQLHGSRRLTSLPAKSGLESVEGLSRLRHVRRGECLPRKRKSRE